MTIEPQAFLSYAHADDDFLDGRISRLRDKLQAAVRYASGGEFHIFQDKDGIAFGQHWPDRLDEALARSRFLIPIVSPSYFASEPCRRELAKFLELERALGRNDLILPIYISTVDPPGSEDESEAARLARALFERQYRDWREEIFEPLDQPAMLRAIRALASEIVAAERRAAQPAVAPPEAAAAPLQPTPDPAPTADAPQPSARHEDDVKARPDSPAADDAGRPPPDVAQAGAEFSETGTTTPRSEVLQTASSVAEAPARRENDAPAGQSRAAGDAEAGSPDTAQASTPSVSAETPPPRTAEGRGADTAGERLSVTTSPPAAPSVGAPASDGMRGRLPLIFGALGAIGIAAVLYGTSSDPSDRPAPDRAAASRVEERGSTAGIASGTSSGSTREERAGVALGGEDSTSRAAPASYGGPSMSLRLASAIPTGLVGQRAALNNVVERVRAETDARVTIEAFEPGTIVPTFEILDAVGAGTVELGWASPSYWLGKDPAFVLVGGPPFGKDAPDHAAWLRSAAVRKIVDELYGLHGVVSVPCASLGVHGDLWLKRPVDRPAQLQGQKIRVVGSSADVMRKMGASVVLLPGGEIFPAMERGVIEGTNWLGPAADLAFGLYQVADQYYFPGVLEPGEILELLVNASTWQALGSSGQQLIERICAANVAATDRAMAELDASAVTQLRAKGVSVTPWPSSVEQAMRDAWREVAAEKSTKSETFARLWRLYR